MKKLEYHLTPPREWFEVLHKQLPSTMDGSELTFTQDMGKGSLVYTTLQDGLWTIQMGFHFRDSLRIYAKPKKVNDCFGIYFYLSDTPMQYAYNSHVTTLGRMNASILLNSSAADMEMMIPPHQNVHIFSIVFTRTWLLENLLRNEDMDEVGKLFLSDKPIYIFENLNVKFHKIIADLVAQDTPRISIFSGVLQLLDGVFIKLKDRASGALVPANIYHDDFQHLLKAKNLIDLTLRESVPVEQLAQEASMSLSKFKSLFKLVFGTTPYRYYLQNRMEAAMDLLSSGDHTVSEVGFQVGYSNLSQFSSAFKKQFGILPSEVC